MNTATALKQDVSANKILQQFNQLKDENPSLRPKDAADKMDITEGELVAARIDGKTIFRIEHKPEEMLPKVKTLGEVMALTRNHLCVHERKGVYDNVSFFTQGPKMGLIVNPDIDLRLFMSCWAHAFAVAEITKTGVKKSIQFFAKDGMAIHKIYLTPKSDESAYDALMAEYMSADQSTEMAVEPASPQRPELPDSQVDAKAFEADLAVLKDTHDFYLLLHKHKIGRTQSYRLISDEYARKVPNNCARTVLEAARDKNCEIMVFVGNKGCIQIHTGSVSKLVEYGEYYNVLDPNFNLHLKDKEIASSYVVRKPTEDGIVTSVEMFDKAGELIVTFFGKRKPGIPELELWRQIVAELPNEAAN